MKFRKTLLAMLLTTTIVACAESEVGSGAAADRTVPLQFGDGHAVLGDWFRTVALTSKSTVLPETVMVPEILLTALPDGGSEQDSVDRRKERFLAMLLPIIVQVNSDILADRAFIEDALARRRDGGTLADDEAARLRGLADRYAPDRSDEELLQHVDVIPPSLALAQAAIESGWGTSRFAMEGNALFGQRVYSENGMTARRAGKSAGFRVQRFDSLLDSVRAYADNLNTHGSYAAMRAERSARRAAARPVEGVALAGTLIAYSERGRDYADDVALVIRANGLDRLDRVVFRLALPGARLTTS